MAKIKVTYLDLNGDCRQITQHGIDFYAGQPVEIDTSVLGTAAALALHKWRGNPFFEVVGGEEIVHTPPAPKQVDPRELDPEEVEYAELVKADAEAKKKQAETLAKNAAAMSKGTHKSQPTAQHKDWRK